MFDNLKADLARLAPGKQVSMRTLISGLLSQGFQAIMVYRLFNWLHNKNLPGQPLRFILERSVEITCGISIPACCTIGKGLRIHHFGGIIFHPTTKIGENCTLYHGVTIGDRGGEGNAATIGKNVLVGAGAKIIGEITVGDNVVIGANAVVTKDVPSDTVVVGTPARYLPRKEVPTEVSVDDSKSIPVRVMDFRGTYKGGGGPDKTVLNSAALHDKNRVDVRVVYIRDPKDPEFQIGDRARSMGLNYTEVLDRNIFDLKCIYDLIKFVKKEKIDILHCHDDKTLLYGVFVKIFKPSIKIIFTVHLHTPLEEKEFSYKGSYIKALARRKFITFLMKLYKNPLMSVSDCTRDSLGSDGINIDNVVTLRNCIDTNLWKKESGSPILKKELGIPECDFLVGTVARIAQKHKDLPTFYQVAKNITERMDNVKFVIVGDGHADLLEKAREEVKSLGLDGKLFFTGHRNDLYNIYRSFDLFLMTSYTEGLPNTVLESMAMGVPVVSTSVSGVPEIIQNGVSGFLCEIRDVNCLSDGVYRLLTDHALRHQFELNGRKVIEDQFEFSWRVEILEEFYLAYQNKKPVSYFNFLLNSRLG